MKYRALLSAIVVIFAVGLLSAAVSGWVLHEGRAVSAEGEAISQASNGDQDEANAVPIAAPIVQLVATEWQEVQRGSYYARERLSRASYRCEFGNCLFTGGGGLIGNFSMSAFYTTIERQGFDGETHICPALYVTDAPAALARDAKFETRINEAGALILPIDLSQLNSGEIQRLTRQTSFNNQVGVVAFIPDSQERGVEPCYSPIHVIGLKTDQ